jgi:hypothetical protein
MGIQEKIDALPGDAKEMLLEALDDMSRPLNIRELDLAFAKASISRTDRRRTFKALKGVNIIAIIPKE